VCRIEELYGEDTYHVSRLGVAMVSGLQGGTDPHTSLATNHSVVGSSPPSLTPLVAIFTSDRL
jgi:beta-glucosidase-like glycosyl hydrolase